MTLPEAKMLYPGSILVDLIALLVLMFAFARHEADWEPTTARSGIYFWYLNPKAVLVFLPQFALCRLLMHLYWGPGQMVVLALFFLPLPPLLHRFFYVPWRKAFLIAACFLAYMSFIALGIYRESVAEVDTEEGNELEKLLREQDDSEGEGEASS